MKLAIPYIAVTIGNIAFFTLLYILFPSLRDNLVEEDKFLENLTALIFFQGFIIGAINIYRFKSLRHRKIYLFIPLIALLGFLDELSFGERIFGFSFPVFYGIKIDAAHDIFNLAKNIYRQEIRPLVITPLKQFLSNSHWLLIVAAICLFVVIFKYRKSLLTQLKFLKTKLQQIWKDWPLRFCLLALVFLSISVGIELRFFGSFRGRTLIEELSEANMAIGFLFAALSLRYSSKELSHSTELRTQQSLRRPRFLQKE